MSRLESNLDTSFDFTLNKIPDPRPLAWPMEQRQEAIALFDLEAERTSGERVEVYPKDIQEYLDNAALLMNNNEFSLAANLYRAILMRDSQNRQAMVGMGEALKRLGRHSEAVRYFRIAHQVYPNPETAARIADEYYAMGSNDEAYEYYFEAMRMGLADGPRLFVTLKNLGNLSVLRNDLAAAEEFYNKAYTLNPDSDVLMVNYGSLEVQRGDLNKAVEMFRRAVELNDANDKAWVGLALIHREFSDVELAWANLEKALDINPHNETAAKLVAEWAIRDNEVERAIDRLEAFLEGHEQNALMTMWLAKFLYLTGKFDQAEMEINKALDIDPTLEGGIEVLSVIRQEKSRREMR